jgi:hypothetical protein
MKLSHQLAAQAVVILVFGAVDEIEITVDHPCSRLDSPQFMKLIKE